MKKPWWEDSLCWLCDYGTFVVVFLLVMVLALIYRFGHIAVPSMPPMPASTLTATATRAFATLTHTPQSLTKSASTPTPIITTPSLVEKPEFMGL